MSSGRLSSHRKRALLALAALWSIALAGDGRAARLEGRVVDLNGQPLAGAMVTWEKAREQSGPTAVTVFTDDAGRFRFPEDVQGGRLSVKALGYRMVDAGRGSTLIMRAEANQAGIAPASAWLGRVADPAVREAAVMSCVGCHQLPAPEVRAYAKSIHDVSHGDAAASRESWRAMVQYMNYLSAWEFGRGGGQVPDASRVYSGGEPGPTAEVLTHALIGPLDRLEGYQYGAPLLVNARTVIREYEVPLPNTIREAASLADPGSLWAADVSSNRMIRIDTTTGATRDYEVPVKAVMGPHTLVPARDGQLWVTSFFPGIVARLDPVSGQWRTWALRTPDGKPIGVHDLSFDTNHDLLTDRHGRIWYSDIVDNAVGWFDPRSGRTAVYPVPTVPDRVGNEQLYGLAMTSDRRHVWYSQLGIGCFGSLDIETGKFETLVQLPDRNAGPRRIALSDDDVLYVPLYGSGQLVEYDTRARRMIGTYDLPDRASAPYATVWDPMRQVVWIATSNANVIYRFDPKDKSFAVLPLPREGAFLRILFVDRTTGALVTSYANIVTDVHGPRMALMIDPGDLPPRAGRGASASPAAATAPAAPAAAAAPPPPSAGVGPGAADVPGLLQQRRCVACHDATAGLIGPPYVAIAARHGAEGPGAVEVLAHKIVLGGGGSWGVVPMPPSDPMPLEEARVIARWILAQKPVEP
jgi:streptogramin lyase/cytochrome c551/c552